MKKFFIFLLMVNVLTGNPAAQTRPARKVSTAETLINYEKQTWEAVKQKDLKTFTDFIAEDFTGVYPDADNVNKSQLLQSLQGIELKDYQLTNFRAKMLSSQAAVISYDVASRLIENGKEILPRAKLVSVWVKKNGKWKITFYREVSAND